MVRGVATRTESLMPDVGRLRKAPGPHSYEYNSLAEGRIRVFRLEPGEPQDVITVRLEVAHLDGLPEYDAISYAWSSNTSDAHVICDSKQINITANLHAALRQFRHGNESRTLWADAICIDQHDVDEKNRQVALMRNVYHRATAVLIWLGEEQDTDRKAFDELGLLHDAVQWLQRPNQTFRWDKSRTQIPSHVLNRLLREVDQDDCTQTGLILPQSYLSPFRRSWFSRTWVIQEIVLSKRAIVHCGRLCIDWTVLGDVIRHIPDLTTMEDKNSTPLIGLDADAYPTISGASNMLRLQESHEQHAERGKSFLAYLLFHSVKCMVSDPRDKVFALLGLCDEAVQTAVGIDYARSPLEVFRRTAEFLMTTADATCLLGLQRLFGPPPEDPHWPSWVPNFAAEHVLNASAQMIDTSRGSNRARGHNTIFEARIDERVSSKIEARGVVAGEVVELAHCEPAEPESLADGWQGSVGSVPWSHRRIRALHDFAVGEIPPRSGQMPPEHAIWSAACGGIGVWREGDVWDRDAESYERYCEFFNVSLQAQWSDVSYPTDGTDSVHQRFLASPEPRLNASQETNWWLARSERWTFAGFILCRLQEGHLAWVPKDSKIGDKIAVFGGPGAECPIVLRPTADGCHKVIGYSWVQGMMEGEMMPQNLDELTWIPIT